MILRGLHTLDGRMLDRKIGGPEKDMHLHDALIFPGLVNAHDHLEFNLFPQLGKGPYTDYTQWGEAIHAQAAGEIAPVLQVPRSLRIAWGLYKNLLSGITTVVHHGDQLFLPQAPIRVWQEAQTIHSVRQDPLWRLRLNNPRHARKPCMIHIGEGCDEASSREVDRLLRNNLLGRPLIGIHGMAVRSDQSERFRALVWCPSSNLFLYGATAPVDRWKTNILFGTDSTLTAPWDIWTQLRQARHTWLLSDADLLNTLFSNPYRVLGPPRALVDATEDFVIARKKRAAATEAFFAIDPEDILLVVAGGKVRLVDNSLVASWPAAAAGFSAVQIRDSIKWVEGDLPGLMASICRFHPGALFPVSLPARETAGPAAVQPLRGS